VGILQGLQYGRTAGTEFDKSPQENFWPGQRESDGFNWFPAFAGTTESAGMTVGCGDDELTR